MIRKALEIFNNSSLFQRDIARATWKLGCILQDAGDIAAGRIEIEKAEKARKIELKEDWYPATSEKDWDSMIIMWSR